MPKQPLITSGGDGRARQESAVSADFLVSLLEKKQFTLPESEMQALMEAPPNTPQTQTVWQLQGLREAVVDCIDKLNEKQITCINAIFVEQITYEELAQRLNYKNKASVYTIVQDSLKNLKEIMLEHPTIQKYLGNDEYEDWE